MQNYPACKELKTAGRMANHVDTDQMLHFVDQMPNLGLHCLLWYVSHSGNVRQHFFVEIDHEIFSLHFADSKRAVVSFWRKNVHITG